MRRLFSCSLVVVLSSSAWACSTTNNTYIEVVSDAGVEDDARSDRSQTAHDGGTDATKDGTTDGHVVEVGTEGGTHETGLPDVIVTSDGSKDAPVDTFTCIPTSDPSSEPCVINEMFGVFVAPAANGGSDTTGMGSRAAPYATISHALASLGGLSRVYVCNGAYTDQITVTGAVGIFGGLTCGTAGDGGPTGPWAYAMGTKATVAGSLPTFTIEVNAGSAAVDIEDMEFDAAAGTAASPSSIAMFAVSSTAVTMERVTLTSGTGFAGSPGTPGSNYSATQASAGNQATGSTPGPTLSCECVDQSTSMGGRGGLGDPSAPSAGAAGGPTIPGAPATAGMPGQYSGGACANGLGGASSATVAGGIGASSAGSIDDASWKTGPPGGSGATAAAAQGGGGGSGGTYSSTPSGGGGGGGCGGCGGAGGAGGSTGGSSFALLSLSSSITLDACALTAGGGGAGGGGGYGSSRSAGR